MEAYNQQRSVSPYCSEHYSNRGSGFGALAAGIGRIAALPIASKFLWPVVKRIGHEQIVQAAPELLAVVTKKKSPKQAIKSIVGKKLYENKLEDHW